MISSGIRVTAPHTGATMSRLIAESDKGVLLGAGSCREHGRDTRTRRPTPLRMRASAFTSHHALGSFVAALANVSEPMTTRTSDSVEGVPPVNSAHTTDRPHSAHSHLPAVRALLFARFVAVKRPLVPSMYLFSRACRPIPPCRASRSASPMPAMRAASSRLQKKLA